ncbi:inositol phosphorylceramide synthase, partial [Cronobacter sakazakii]
LTLLAGMLARKMLSYWMIQKELNHE